MRTARIVLQILLTAAFAAGLAAQVWWLPQYADAAATEYPVLAWVRTPCLVVAVLVIACVQVALVAVAALLAPTVRHRIARSRAFLLADIAIGAVLAATALCLGLGLWLQLAADFDSPADFALYVIAALGLGVALVGGAVRLALKRSLPPAYAT